MWSNTELSQLDWREIKEIAESLQIPKPENGWTEAIPLILEKQSSNQNLLFQSESGLIQLPESIGEDKSNSVDQEETLPKSSQEQEMRSRFSTGFYQAIGVETCSYCGEKKRFFAGKQICPIAKSDCPNK
jgi:hypothetical protein